MTYKAVQEGALARFFLAVSYLILNKRLGYVEQPWTDCVAVPFQYGFIISVNHIQYPVSNWFVIIGRWNVLIQFEFCGDQPVGYLLPFCVHGGEVARGPLVYSLCIQPSKHYEFQLAFSASNKG